MTSTKDSDRKIPMHHEEGVLKPHADKISIITKIMKSLPDDKKMLEYIASGGAWCPFCGSRHDFGGGFVEIDSGKATQPMHCVECDKRWIDIYTLTGVRHGS
jgi:hypothetical protein